MNHSFHASLTNNDMCAHCKFPELMHGPNAICEACNNIGPVDIVYGNMLMCKDCQEKEKKAYTESMKPEKQQERVDSMNAATVQNQVIAQSRAIDSSIQVRTDIFNAATISITDLKKAIDADETIQNKPYALAQELTNRFNHYKGVIFEANQQIMDASSNQRAIQVYLNDLANKLRAEERENLKLQDINYQPKPVKPTTPKNISTKGTKSTASKKLDMKELAKFAAELGVAQSTLQMIATSKGLTIEAAANMLRRTIAEAKSEAN